MTTGLIRAGDRLPDAMLGELERDAPRPVGLREVLGRDRAVVFGVPGAFTPVCTREHVPDFVAGAHELRASGFAHILCVTPNDPWVNAAWQAQVDPRGALRFLSDGNLALARALGALAESPELFFGVRPRRYFFVARDGFVQCMALEPEAVSLTCTRAEDVPRAA